MKMIMKKEQIHKSYIKNGTIQHDLIHASLSDIHLPTILTLNQHAARHLWHVK